MGMSQVLMPGWIKGSEINGFAPEVRAHTAQSQARVLKRHRSRELEHCQRGYFDDMLRDASGMQLWAAGAILRRIARVVRTLG